jgi:hypothetical protein
MDRLFSITLEALTEAVSKSHPLLVADKATEPFMDVHIEYRALRNAQGTSLRSESHSTMINSEASDANMDVEWVGLEMSKELPTKFFIASYYARYGTIAQLLRDSWGNQITLPIITRRCHVKRITILIMMWVSIFALAGCAAPLLGGLTGGSSSGSATSSASMGAALSTNLTPPSIFDQLEKSTMVGLIGLAAFLYENGQLDGTVIIEQCRFHTADPPFLVPEDPSAQKGWVFTGRLNSDDELQEMQALEYRSFFGLGWSKQQTSTWPLGLTTLSEMPNAYLEQRLEMLASVKLEKAQQDSLAQGYIGDSQKIEEAVGRLEKTYNPEECIQKKN